MLNDLHTHSNESDGSLSPEELILLAVKQNVSTIALCDHDTTAGLQRFVECGKKHNVMALPGIELSAEWPEGNCHILGLNIKSKHSALEQMLEKTRGSRGDRNELILEKLKTFGIQISIDKVRQYAGGEVIARPHIAQALVDNGYAESVNDAFDRYLAKGKPAYLDRFRLVPSDAVRLLSEAGAFVSIAHPSHLKINDEQTTEFISQMKDCGLRGIEVYTPYSNDKQIQFFEKLADDFDLIKTGGSDYHGISKPENRLGYYRIDKRIPAIDINKILR